MEGAEVVTKKQLCYFMPIITYAFYVFFITGPWMGGFPLDLFFMLLLIGVFGSALAGFNGRTPIAVISGMAFWVICGLFLIVAVIHNIDFIYLLAVDILVFYSLVSLFVGGAILAIAFITHVNKKFSKLRFFYFIPSAVFVLGLLAFVIESLFWGSRLVRDLINKTDLEYLEGYLVGEISILTIIYVCVYYFIVVLLPIFIRFGVAVSTVAGLNSIYSNTPPAVSYKN